MKSKFIVLYLCIILICCINLTVFADDIGYTTVGSSSNTIGNESATNVYGSKYTSTTGGTLTTAYINGHTNWNGTDTVVILVYDDTGGYPYSLIAESAEIEINSSSYQWWSGSISGTIAPSTDYWIFVRNKTVGSATVRIHNDANTITGYRTADVSPTNNPFANGATVNNNSQYSIYLSYTTGGSGEPTVKSNRRRKILHNMYGGYSEENNSFAFLSTINK